MKTKSGGQSAGSVPSTKVGSGTVNVTWLFLGSAKFFINSLVSVLVSVAGERYGISPLQVLFFLGILNLLVSASQASLSEEQWSLYMKALHLIRPRQSARFFHVFMCGTAAPFGWFTLFITTSYISNADGWTLAMASALCATLPAEWYLFGQKPSLLSWISVLGCMVGCTLVTQPPLIFGNGDTPFSMTGLIMGLITGLLDATSFVGTAALDKRNYSVFVYGYTRQILSGVLYLFCSTLFFFIRPNRWVSIANGGSSLTVCIVCGLLLSLTDPMMPITCLKLGGQMTALLSQSAIVYAALLEVVFLHKLESPLHYFGIVMVIVSIGMQPMNDLYCSGPMKTLNKHEESSKVTEKKHTPTMAKNAGNNGSNASNNGSNASSMSGSGGTNASNTSSNTPKPSSNVPLVQRHNK